MKKLILAGVTVLALAGCQNVNWGEVDHSAYAQFALGQVKAWNAAGVDPVQLDEDKIAYLIALCGTVVGALDAGLIEVDNLTAENVLDYCEAAITAARPATPSP